MCSSLVMYNSEEKKMKYKINEITPKSMACVIGSCPSIYEGLRELTPQEMACIVGTCPSPYEAMREGKEVYLIVGTVVNPSESGLEGLEKKVGEGEALIEVPRALIDNRRK